MWKTTKTTIIKNVSDKIGKKVEEICDKVGDICDDIGNIDFGDIDFSGADSGSSSSTIQTSHMNVKIKDQQVVINGDVTLVKLNGTVIFKAPD